MHYTCPKCKTVLSASEELLKEPTPSLKCTKCGFTFNPVKETPFDSEKIAKMIRQLLNSDLH